MNKVLISIRPEWVAKILNKHKTIEVRKSFPKCDLPCEVYIYCTKGTVSLFKRSLFYEYSPSVDDGEWVCGKINHKVVAKFTLKKVETYKWEKQSDNQYGYPNANGTGLFEFQMCNYGIDKNDDMRTLYGWVIDNLKIFKEPKTLADFGINKAPQSWCYIKEVIK